MASPSTDDAGEIAPLVEDEAIHTGWYSFPGGRRQWTCSTTCPHPEHLEQSGRNQP